MQKLTQPKVMSDTVCLSVSVSWVLRGIPVSTHERSKSQSQCIFMTLGVTEYQVVTNWSKYSYIYSAHDVLLML